MNSTKKERISSPQLFCILFSSRLAGLMITGEITLESFFAQLALTSGLSALAYVLADKLKRTEIREKAACFLCIIIALVSFFSVSDFKENAVIIGVSSLLSVAVIALAVLYTARLGVETVARISGLCAAALSVMILIGILSNLKACSPASWYVRAEGFSPLNIIKSLDIPVLYFRLSKNVKGNKKRALALSVALSYAAAAAMYAVCAMLLGSAVKHYCYPVFTAFQLGVIGSYNKLDIMFTAPMLSAFYLKLSALLVRVKK